VATPGMSFSRMSIKSRLIVEPFLLVSIPNNFCFIVIAFILPSFEMVGFGQWRNRKRENINQ
jgi:hypothetical protein